MMKTSCTVFLTLALLAACSSPLPPASTPDEIAVIVKKSVGKVETTPDATATMTTLADYKRYLAERISEVNSTKVYAERPQALLRSVVVVKYVIDAGGNLLRSEIFRSNHDRATEAAALSTLKNTAPFPKPGPRLLRNGKVEILETWLFNNDGRFQLRSIAQPQMGE